MKKKILFIATLYLFTINLISQEGLLPSKAIVPEEIIEMDKYFNNLYEENGKDLSKMKGTGYMQFVRSRNFYEQRRNFEGKIDNLNRWNKFENIRSNPNRNSGPLANWESIGPTDMDGHGGRIISHAFDPINPDVLWVGGASGGLWLSEDGGSSWQSKSDDIPATGVGGIAINPVDSNMIVIGTGEGFAPPGLVMRGGIGVFRSIDGGTTWLPTSFAFPVVTAVSVLKMAWHPTDVNKVWMAATNGLWRSDDMGQNWTAVFGDGTNHQNFIFNDIIIQESNPDIIFVAHEGVGVFKSTNGGTNFNLLTNGIPTTDINFISIDQCKSQPDILYASIARQSTLGLHGVYKSEDNGTSWAQIPNVPDAFCTTNGLGTFCQGWYDNTIAVGPNDPDLVLFGGITFWRSTNGGLNWEQKDRSACSGCVDTPACATYVDHHDLGFDPHNPNTCYSFNDGGVSKSDDLGNCWESKNDGLVTAQFVSVASGTTDTNVVIGGLQDHGLMGANISNGLHWERWGFFDGANVRVDHENEDRFFGTWINGSYWRSINGTNSLATQITNGIDLNENSTFHFAPLDMDPNNSLIILGSTQQGIYRSSSRGNNWEKVHSASIVSDLSFSRANPDYCYAAAWTGSTWNFYRSEDNGQTWNVTQNAPGWRVTDVETSGINPLVVFASRNSINSNNPHIYKSNDGGENWTSIQGDLPDLIVNAIAVDQRSDDVIYAATDLGLFITIDGGQQWTEFNEGMPITFVMDIEINEEDRKLRAATMGRGVWIADAYPIELGIEDSIFENSFVIYPNPSDGDFTIEFSNTIEIKEIAILNFLGQEIKTLSETEIGQELINVSITNMMRLQSNGVYFIKVKTKNQYYTKKLILNK
jgi:photosystem II stability/assembly factor-like uncharacterized protein